MKAENDQSCILTVIIPFYNEQELIVDVLERIAKAGLRDFEIVAVDDGSNDESRTKFQGWAASNRDIRTKLVVHEVNQGKSAAIKSAFPEVQGKYIIIQDADLEYDPQDISRVVDTLLEKGVDAVIGTRKKIFHRRSFMDFLLKLGSLILTMMFNIVYKKKISDMSGGYKAFKFESIQSCDFKFFGFTFCYEAVARIIENGGSVLQVPISYNPRSRAEGKKIRIIDGIIVFRLLIELFLFERILNRKLLFLLLTGFAMLIPAIYNEGPLIFLDSYDYLDYPAIIDFPRFHHSIIPAFVFYYLSFKLNFILVPILLNVITVVLSLSRFIDVGVVRVERLPFWFFLFIVPLISFSAVSYNTSMIMVDSYYLVVCILTCVILKVNRNPLWVYILLIFALIVHLTHLVLFIVVLGFLFLLRFRIKKKLLLILFVSMAISCGDYFLRARYYHSDTLLTTFLAGTFAEEGILQKNLKAFCAQKGERSICRNGPSAISTLPDHFIWDSKSVLHSTYQKGSDRELETFQYATPELRELLIFCIMNDFSGVLKSFFSRVTIDQVKKTRKFGGQFHIMANKRLIWPSFEKVIDETLLRDTKLIRGTFSLWLKELFFFSTILACLLAVIGIRRLYFNDPLILVTLISFFSFHFFLVPYLSTHTPRYFYKAAMCLYPILLTLDGYFSKKSRVF